VRIFFAREAIYAANTHSLIEEAFARECCERAHPNWVTQPEIQEYEQMSRFIPLIACAVAALWIQVGRAAVTEVANEQEPTRHPYQVFSSASCTLAGVCAVEFPAITTGRTLVMHASCRFSMSTAGYVSYAFLNVGPAEPIENVPSNNLPLFSFSSKSGSTSYGINTATYFFFETGETPAIAIETADAAAGTVFCTLNGYYY
jgi:hypothetical protein